MNKNLKLFLASLVLAISCQAQLSAKTPNFATEEEYTKKAAKSTQAKQISALLKQISEQKDPSAIKALGKELGLILASVGMAEVGFAGSYLYKSNESGFTDKFNKDVLKKERDWNNHGVSAIVGACVVYPVIMNLLRTGKNCFSNKTSKTLKQLKLLASSSELSEEEVQELNEEVSAAEAKLSCIKNPTSARIFRALVTIASAVIFADLFLVANKKPEDLTKCSLLAGALGFKKEASDHSQKTMGWAEAKAGYKDSWLKVAVVYATYLICLTLVEGTESWNTNSNLKKIAEIKKLIAGAQK